MHPPPPQISSSSGDIHHPMITRSRDNSCKPQEFPNYVAHQSNLESEPSTFKQVMSSEQWRNAMTQELNALATNNTWILVPPPTNQRIIGCKWVYKVKHKPDGSIEHYKARLVVKGYSQEAEIDYVETYSPVVRATTIRIILSLAVCSD
jgi:Reverse transcriptase (RNA-dependent DNA polymerase)